MSKLSEANDVIEKYKDADGDRNELKKFISNRRNSYAYNHMPDNIFATLCILNIDEVLISAAEAKIAECDTIMDELEK